MINKGMVERIISERKRLGMTQTEFALLCKVTARTQRSYEYGLREPKAEYFTQMATAGSDIFYIITGQVGVQLRKTPGSRLKEERSRIGLGQDEFGKACGCGRTAQYTYEADTRSPDVAYLLAADKIGVDILYVVTGRHENGRAA